MKNSEKKLGVSLWVLGMLISGEAAAQTCVIPPTCEELGYDKVASDCGSLAKLKCPFDDMATSFIRIQFQQNLFQDVFRSELFMT